MKNRTAFISGLIFSFGLGISGMTRPHVVKGFLDVFGDWDWKLLGVMAGAISIHFIAYRLIRFMKSPVFAEEFKIPYNKFIDRKLVLGAAIFGLGWGWSGICPGPAIVGLASFKIEFLIFVVSMLIGMKVFQLMEKKVI